MKKGVFKQYRRFEYNNTNIKGSIDIARHIKSNTPFTGKVAYSTREFTQDNDLMQLVRHTIEFIRLSAKNGRIILNSSELTKQNVAAVILVTSSYNLGNKRKVIIANKTTPVRHAYYTEYLALQKLCLMILTHTRHSLGGKSNNIHGILFDVAWLWEEYLNTIFKDDFIHPRNKQNSGGIAVFVDGKRIVYPDFYNKKIDMIVDAKYKDLTDQSISREDLYQIISYSYILESKIAGVVFPSKNESKLSKIGKLSGYGANIFKQSFHIPQQVHVYREFDACIKKSEDDFKIKLKDYYIEIQKHNKEAES
jgi:5-methylcytosine-specific restriction endonuclease McrBC regulatory subunit McrC